MQRLDPLEERFLKTVKENNLINEGDIIVIGVSGGPDSITLLSCLNKYKEKMKCKLLVAHVNHLIREESTEDEQYVERICQKYNIPVFIRREDILNLSAKWKKGTEETGRIIRYEFFDEIAKKNNANKIAIAHNMNDNAETMILNLIRGTGLSGLEGIQPYKYGRYIRPLIDCTRNQIEAYCKKNKLEPRIDYTNNENIYNRNKIRNEVIPYLKQLNPSIIETLSRTSKIISQNNTFIEKQAAELYKKIAEEEIIKSDICTKVEFIIQEFNKQEKAMKNLLILMAIKRIIRDNRNIENIHIEDIIKLAQRNVGNKYLMINKNIKVEVKNNKLLFYCI